MGSRGAKSCPRFLLFEKLKDEGVRCMKVSVGFWMLLCCGCSFLLLLLVVGVVACLPCFLCFALLFFESLALPCVACFACLLVG